MHGREGEDPGPARVRLPGCRLQMEMLRFTHTRMHARTHTHAHAPQPKVCKAKRHPTRKQQPLDETEGVERAHVVRSPGQPHHKARCRSHQRPHQTQVPAAPRITEIADAFIWLNALQPWGPTLEVSSGLAPPGVAPGGQRASFLEAPGSQLSGAGDNGCLQT